jgi:hypothetical protein
MATENRNPKNAKPVGGRQDETNTGSQAGQASRDVGNVKGQKVAQQQGARGTVDQAADRGKLHHTQHATGGLRQGTVDTEERED